MTTIIIIGNPVAPKEARMDYITTETSCGKKILEVLLPVLINVLLRPKEQN
jgi:hypothetical protein